MKRLVLALRIGVALLAAWGAVTWGARQFAEADRIAAWERSMRSRRPSRLAELRPPPPDSSLERRFARLLEVDLFPPNYAGSTAALGRALALDPLNSQDWLKLARQRLLTGRTEEARAALRRSDVLDPNFPGQRAEAIQLWAYLGDRDAAMHVAQGIARIDGEGRRTAARELLLSGFTPAEAFAGLNGPSHRGRELAQILSPLITRDTAASRALFAQLPGDVWDSPEFCAEMLPRLARPLLHKEALRAWHPGFRAMAPEALPRVGIVNASLRSRPFDDTTVLGWQQPPRGRNVASRYRSPKDSAAPGERGTIRLSYADTVENTDATTAWRFYYLPVEAGTSTTITLKLKCFPPERSICRLVVRNAGRGWSSAPTDWTIEDWQDLAVDLPAQPNDAVFELSLERTRRGGSDSTRPEVTVAGFEVVAVEMPPSP